MNTLIKICFLCTFFNNCCKISIVVGFFVTTLTLSHSFTANGVKRNQEYQHTSPPPTRPPTLPPTRPTTTRWPTVRTTSLRTTTMRTTTLRTTTPEVKINNFDILNEQCGKRTFTEKTHGGLIVKGKKADRDQFPWLVAYYRQTRQTTEPICGGSLISSKLVVTAAHCIQGKKQSVALKAENSLFYAGKYDIHSIIEDFNQKSFASELIVHPDWNPHSTEYDSDIAIAVLKDSLEFKTLVKPICIWRETESQFDIIGKNGSVAGWGYNEANKDGVSQYPMFVDIPAVDYFDCAKSDRSLFDIVSRKSFCAGVKNSGVGPCNGDSGEF